MIKKFKFFESVKFEVEDGPTIMEDYFGLMLEDIYPIMDMIDWNLDLSVRIYLDDTTQHLFRHRYFILMFKERKRRIFESNIISSKIGEIQEYLKFFGLEIYNIPTYSKSTIGVNLFVATIEDVIKLRKNYPDVYTRKF